MPFRTAEVRRSSVISAGAIGFKLGISQDQLTGSSPESSRRVDNCLPKRNAHAKLIIVSRNAMPTLSLVQDTDRTMTVRAAVLDLLRAFRMTSIFGNPGSTELPLF